MGHREDQPLAEIVRALGDLRDLLFKEGRYMTASHIGQAVSCLSTGAMPPLPFLDD